jgi:serine/threonine protein kinase
MSDIPRHLAAALADRYVLEREIGTGGMATVYLARDLRHKRSVAVKVVRPELGGRDGVERFLREIERCRRGCGKRGVRYRSLLGNALRHDARRRHPAFLERCVGVYV